MQSKLSAVVAAGLRSLPEWRGRGRGAQLLHSWAGNKEELAVCEMKLGYKMRVDLRSSTELPAYYLGDFDTGMIRSLTSRFDRDWVVLDVGANVGFYSVPFAQRLASVGGKLHCFEPVPSNCQRLQENLKLNGIGKTANLHNFGLSDQDAEMRISLREDFESGATTGNASIVIDDHADERFQIIGIQVRRFDAIWPGLGHDRLDLIKVDIEGHEDRFLAGARDAIAKHRPLIFMEVNEPYYQRRGMKSEDFILPFLSAREYVGLFWKGRAGWIEKPYLEQRRRSNDDVLLCPLEKKHLLA